MKTNYWMILVVMLATGAVAQDVTNVPSPEALPPTAPAATEVAPAPAAVDTNTPTDQKVKKKITRHKRRKLEATQTAMTETSVTLVPGPAEVVVSNINVRGQASLKSEVIAHLFMGDTVTVFEQINLAKHKPDEPAQWAKISYPTNAHVWVSAKYIDTNSAVSVKKLNLRDGPGENFSVVGIIERGTPVTQVEIKDDWMKIEPPTNAYAFVAAMYLKQETNAAPETNVPSAETNTPPVETNTVAEPPPIVSEATNSPAETNAGPIAPIYTNTIVPPPMETNAPAPEAAEPEAPPPPPRIIQHEGVVRHVVSPVAPTDYELFDPATGQNIDYLYTTSTNLDLSLWNGQRVVVTGQEGLDARWKDTPVITIQRIQLVQ